MFWFVLPQLIKKIEKSQNLVFSASRLMIAKRWTEIVKTCSTPRLSVYNNIVVSLLSEWFSSLWTFALYGRFLPAKNSPRASLSMCGISTQILFSGAVCSLTGQLGTINCVLVFLEVWSHRLSRIQKEEAETWSASVPEGMNLSVSFSLIFAATCEIVS